MRPTPGRVWLDWYLSDSLQVTLPWGGAVPWRDLRVATSLALLVAFDDLDRSWQFHFHPQWRRLPLVGPCHPMIGPSWSKRNGVRGAHPTLSAIFRVEGLWGWGWTVPQKMVSSQQCVGSSFGTLGPRYMLCGGELQSPMDIATSDTHSCVMNRGQDITVPSQQVDPQNE